MSASDYTEINHLAHIAGQATYPAMTHTYVALCISDPGETTVGALAAEVTTVAWPAYARAQAAQGAAMSTGWSAPADSGDGGKQIKNAKILPFAANLGAAQVTVTHWAVFDGPLPAGNLVCADALDTPRIVDVGEAFQFDINTITLKHK
jgi:hypothetical protein